MRSDFSKPYEDLKPIDQINPRSSDTPYQDYIFDEMAAHNRKRADSFFTLLMLSIIVSFCAGFAAATFAGML
jgi:hypothetical protein